MRHPYSSSLKGWDVTAQGCYIPAFQAERPCQPGQSALAAAILAIAEPARPAPRPWFPGGAWTSGKPECPAAPDSAKASGFAKATPDKSPGKPASGSNSAPVPLSSYRPVPGSQFPVPAFYVGCETNNVVSHSAEMRLTSKAVQSSKFKVQSAKSKRLISSFRYPSPFLRPWAE
jgi:hypothetical protein